MPPLTRWSIKSAMLYFVAAMVLAVVDAALPAGTLTSAFRPLYIHLFVVGWITQMIFGVAYWMFPRLSRHRPRGSPALGWATYLALNTGLLLRIVTEPLQALEPGARWGGALVLSAALQWVAAVLFVLNTWGRVRRK